MPSNSSKLHELPAGAQPNFSLIDGMACLQAVVGSETPCATSQLARELDLKPTRVTRLLKTLQYLGFVEQDRSRKYRAGPALHVLAAQSLFGSRLLSIALPFLEELAVYRQVVALGVLWRDQVAYLYHQAPEVTSAEAIGRAGLYPAWQSAIGVALMAQNPPDRLEPASAQVLEETRRRGYAHIQTAEGGHRIGVSIGSPRAIAALAIAGDVDPAEHPHILHKLQTAAERITRISSSKLSTELPQPQLEHVKHDRAA